MHKYRIRINWSEEDHLFVAEVPDLPGCMAHGDSHA
jgi:predicted RNase H-like HicB family nuclease